MNEKVLEVSLENSLADKLADIALAEMSGDEIKNITSKVLEKLDVWRNDKNIWNHKVTKVEEEILKRFYNKVGERVEKLLDEDEEFTATIDMEARRIIRISREAAETYMVEAMARRMCLCFSDFEGQRQKMDMHVICNDLLRNHMEHSHSVPY